VDVLTTSGGTYLYVVLAVIMIVTLATANRPDRWVILMRVAVIGVVAVALTYLANLLLPGYVGATAVAVARSNHHSASTAPVTFRPVFPVAAAFGCGILEIPYAPIATVFSLLLGAIVAYQTLDHGIAGPGGTPFTIVEVGASIAVACVANLIASLVVRPKNV
jgi:hypothetical protein